MAELRKLGILSFAKINAIMSAFFGLLAGIYFAVMGVFAQAKGMPILPGIPTFVLGFAFVLILPLLYGILGFIGGIIVAALYNLFASWFGGIEMKFRMNK